MQVHNVPFFVGVDKVKAGKRPHTHGVFPLIKVGSEIHAIPLLDLPNLVHASVANSVGAVLCSKNRTVLRAQPFTSHCPGKKAPKLELQLDLTNL